MARPRTVAGSLFPIQGRHWWVLILAAFFGLMPMARAAIQFDVFPGYDGIVPEASWFPIICEVKNDGPSFNAVIEISGGRFNEGQTRRVAVELPTGTLKRIEIPAFSTARYQSSWDVRLLDERGRVRAEQTTGQVGGKARQIAAATTLLGALPRSATGVPVFRPIRAQDPEMQPVTARLVSSLFPDNPLALEGMDSVYLNTDRATELNDQQVFALMSWLNNGGHLIVGVEQVSDVNGVAWLRRLVPCDLTDLKTVSSHPELQEWLRRNATVAETDDTSNKRNDKRPRFPDQIENLELQSVCRPRGGSRI